MRPANVDLLLGLHGSLRSAESQGCRRFCEDRSWRASLTGWLFFDPWARLAVARQWLDIFYTERIWDGEEVQGLGGVWTLALCGGGCCVRMALFSCDHDVFADFVLACMRLGWILLLVAAGERCACELADTIVSTRTYVLFDAEGCVHAQDCLEQETSCEDNLLRARWRSAG